MIITVTLNAAIDKTLAVPNFRLGRRHRAVEQTSMAGGKGVNVARALKALGQPVIATGVAGGPTGTRIIEQLTEEAILNDFVEINERGPEVSEAELELFVDKLLYLAKGAGVCVFSGSLPPGIPADLYERLIQELRRLDVTTVLDSEGEALRHGTRAEPTVISPNQPEAEELVGHEFADDEDLPAAVAEMVEMGAREAILTLPDGCIALVGDGTERRLYRGRIDPGLVDARSPVGSGDAFLAGYVASRYTGRAPNECLRFAVACGAESVQHFGAGVLDPGAAERLMSRVEVEVLSEQALSAGG